MFKPKRLTVDKDYGPNVQRPDLSPEEYAIQEKLHYEKLEKWQQAREEIECNTRLQSKSDLWFIVRKKILTASHFGKVCRMRKDTLSSNTVKSILYPPSLNLPALEYGRRCEPYAKEQLEKEENLQIQSCGLFIDPETSFLGATPDGVIGDDRIVEIKCPYAARNLTPEEAISQKVANVHRIFKNSDTMNNKHEYYYQIQGQLHVTRRKYCIFVLWTTKGKKTILICRDDKFWHECMEPLLKRFYECCMVPEIIDSRHNRSMSLREPDYILQAREAKDHNTRK
jgi:YqaJ-like viral recombinase domain.